MPVRSPYLIDMSNLLEIKDRVIVLMGSTSGLGRALATGLAGEGAIVIPSGRREVQLSALCQEIDPAGNRTLCRTSDVRNRDSIDALRDAVLDKFGRIDVLVNAAGVTFKQATVSMSEDQWLALMDTDLTGVLRACQSFYEPLKQSGRGRIINIASLGSFRAFYQVAAYAASKTAVLSLKRSLGCEWARWYLRQRDRPGCFSNRPEYQTHRGNAAGRRNADAYADGAVRQARGDRGRRDSPGI